MTTLMPANLNLFKAPESYAFEGGSTLNLLGSSITPSGFLPSVTSINFLNSKFKSALWNDSVKSFFPGIVSKPHPALQTAVLGALLAFPATALAADPITITAGVGLAAAVGATALLAVGAGIFAAWKKSNREDPSAAKTAFETELQRWKQGLAVDRDQIADFTMDVELKDKITALRIKGEKTKSLYAQVTKLRDEIVLGIEGLEARVKKAEQTVAHKNPDAESYRLALAILTGDMTFNASEVRQGILFEGASSVTITSNTIPELKAKIPAALSAWKRIKDAAQASLHDVRTDFTAKDLESMQVVLKAAGISSEDAAKILAKHPLYNNPEATWSKLKALKDSDPVAYLDELTSALKTDDDLEVYVTLVADAYRRAKEAQDKAERTDLWKNMDPNARQNAASQMQVLLSLIQSVTPADEIDRHASRVIAFYDTLLKPYSQSPIAAPEKSKTTSAGDDWWQSKTGNGLHTQSLPQGTPTTGTENWENATEEWDETRRQEELARREEEVRRRKSGERQANGYDSFGTGSILDEIMRQPQ